LRRRHCLIGTLGVRFGATHQCFAAALARWLSGLLQNGSDFAEFVEAAENIESRRQGTTVELTFNLNGDMIPKRARH